MTNLVIDTVGNDKDAQRIKSLMPLSILVISVTSLVFEKVFIIPSDQIISFNQLGFIYHLSPEFPVVHITQYHRQGRH